MAAVVGIGLLWFGAGALRASRRWVQASFALATLVLLGVSLLTLGQALAATRVPPVEPGTRTPADVGLDAEEVALTTSDDVTLAAWYVESTNGAAVVLAHGAGSTRSSVLGPAAVLADHGYGVLLVDARGHGDSDGQAMDFGWWGDEDLRAAVDHLVGRPDVDPGRIGVLGLSMGGEEAIGAMAADDRIVAGVAEGATVRVAGDRAWLSDEYGWRGALQERLEGVTTWLADQLTPADPPITLREAVAEAAPRPVLLITGGDVEDEALAAEFIRSGAPDSVSVWTVPDAGHTDGLATDPDEWERQVTGFLDDALLD